jgi:CubicO group peptidase (beta-lactamase class C family)
LSGRLAGSDDPAPVDAYLWDCTVGQLSPVQRFPCGQDGQFCRYPLVSTPGGQFSYCSVCYQILAYVVEQVSGEPYSTFLQQAIFDPLQMKDTGFDPGYLSLPDHAVGYASWQVKDIDVGEDMAPQWSFLLGAGLLYSTAEDLYRWDQALYECTLVSQQTLNEAFTPYLSSQDPATSYGYGWFVAQAPTPGHRLVWHDGQLSGFRAYIGRYIDDGVTIIILSNLSRLDELALAQTLQQLVFAHPETSTSPPQSPYGCIERRGVPGK